MPASSPPRRGGIGVLPLVSLLALLVLPFMALRQLATIFDGRLLAGGAVILSALTFALYRTDKNRAQSSEWRIPESTLHFCELIGGWPGAFIAQRTLRHKISKPSYQFTFWLIVLLHQWLALDSLLGWSMTQSLLRRA
jgi:uncharacterized membrane protein YsdA (DUF1294 family)